MDKVHYCERFIELMIDLEVRQQSSLIPAPEVALFYCFKTINSH